MECSQTPNKGDPLCRNCRHYNTENCPYFGMPILPTDSACPEFESANPFIPLKVRRFFKHLNNLHYFARILRGRFGLDAKVIRGPHNFHYLVIVIPKGRKIRFGDFYAKARKQIVVVFYIKNWTKTVRPVSVADVERQLAEKVIRTALIRNGVFGDAVVVFGCQRPLLPKLRKLLKRCRIEYLNYSHRGLSATLRAFLQRLIWKKAGRVRYCPRCGQERIFLKFRKRPTCPCCGSRPYMRRWLYEPPDAGPPLPC